MAKYFMGGTRLEGLEHLMMDSSRSTHSPSPIKSRQKGAIRRQSQTSWTTEPLNRAEARGNALHD